MSEHIFLVADEILCHGDIRTKLVVFKIVHSVKESERYKRSEEKREELFLTTLR